MPFNGAGVFQRVRNWVADATAGIKIRADFHDSEDDNFAAGLTNTITRDGQSVITQNIPFNSKRITGLADPIDPQDAATKKSTTAGGEYVGDILIKKIAPALVLDRQDAASGGLFGQVKEKDRWRLRLGNDNAEVESTNTSVGSDFDIARYDDNGVGLGYVLTFNRKTGLGTVAGDPTDGLGIATKNYAEAAAVAAGSPKVNRSGDVMTGELRSASSQAFGFAGPAGSFLVSSIGGQAAMSFLAGGAFGANFGMATDGNFYMGGWSHGAVVYKFWTTKDVANLNNLVQAARLVLMGDPAVSAATPGGPILEQPGWEGSIMTGWSIASGGTINNFRMRILQLQSTAGTWFSVGYA
jgi:hypothetical protein